MAVSTTSLNSTLIVKYQTGTTPTGGPELKQKSLNYLKAEAEAVMDTVIQKNVFLTPSGELIGKRDIKVVGTTTNDLYDPPQALGRAKKGGRRGRHFSPNLWQNKLSAGIYSESYLTFNFTAMIL